MLLFDSIIKYLPKNKASVHNSIHIYAQYMEEGGCVLFRRQLIAKIVEKFGGDMIALSSPGDASLLVFKSSASNALHIMPDDTDDQMNEAIEKVAKQIKTEINNIEADRKKYYSHIDRDICSVFQSNTLDDIVSEVSQKLKQSLPALLIGNIGSIPEPEAKSILTCSLDREYCPHLL